jgi:hypothetical protein
MAIGYAHIFALPGLTGDSVGVHLPAYQFTFNTGGIAYGKIVGQDELVEFLGDELGLRADVIDDAMKLLTSDGKTTIPNVEISENDAAVMGLLEVGADY